MGPELDIRLPTSTISPCQTRMGGCPPGESKPPPSRPSRCLSSAAGPHGRAVESGVTGDIGGSLCGDAPQHVARMLPTVKVKGVLTGVSPCQNALARGSPDWTRI